MWYKYVAHRQTQLLYAHITYVYTLSIWRLFVNCLEYSYQISSAWTFSCSDCNEKSVFFHFLHVETENFSQPKRFVEKAVLVTGQVFVGGPTVQQLPSLHWTASWVLLLGNGPSTAWSVEMGVVLVGLVFQSSSVPWKKTQTDNKRTNSRRSLRKKQHRKSKMTDLDIQISRYW